MATLTQTAFTEASTPGSGSEASILRLRGAPKPSITAAPLSSAIPPATDTNKMSSGTQPQSNDDAVLTNTSVPNPYSYGTSKSWAGRPHKTKGFVWNTADAKSLAMTTFPNKDTNGNGRLRAILKQKESDGDGFRIKPVYSQSEVTRAGLESDPRNTGWVLPKYGIITGPQWSFGQSLISDMKKQSQHGTEDSTPTKSVPKGWSLGERLDWTPRSEYQQSRSSLKDSEASGVKENWTDAIQQTKDHSTVWGVVIPPSSDASSIKSLVQLLPDGRFRVMKDGSVRLRGDYHLTDNSAAHSKDATMTRAGNTLATDATLEAGSGSKPTSVSTGVRS